MVWNCICGRATAKERYLQQRREADDEELFGKRFKEFEENNGLALVYLKEMGCGCHLIQLGGTQEESLKMVSCSLENIF